MYDQEEDTRQGNVAFAGILTNQKSVSYCDHCGEKLNNYNKLRFKIGGGVCIFFLGVVWISNFVSIILIGH